MERQALERVWAYLHHQDCRGMVRALNEELGQKRARLYLVAGDFASQGVCMKADWPKAARFYAAALEGLPSVAQGRLAAGYADPHMGKEPATALWWALQPRGLPLPPTCADLRPQIGDAERFAQGYAGWTEDRRRQCTYLVGVLGHVHGQATLPARALNAMLSGSYRMRFLPGQGRIEWTRLWQDDGSEGARSLDVASREARNDTLRHLTEASDTALKRFTPPPGFLATDVIEQQFDFTAQYVR